MDKTIDTVEFSFGSKKFAIGEDQPPFIIAELSGNHNGSLDRALQIVDAATKAGAHALKLQTYTADTMTLDISEREFCIDDPESLWKGKSLYRLYKEAHTPWDWHAAIFDQCKKLGLTCFSTPFDKTAVDFLEKLQTPIYKIASFENTDLELIKAVAKTRKPVLLSTGMAKREEIEEAVAALRNHGSGKIVVLKCTSSYPASPSESNLLTIPHLRELLNTHVGLSDHTPGIGAAVASVALGAVAIEKHFTDSRSTQGVDSAFSLEPAELKALVIESRVAWQALGKVFLGPTESEKKSLQFRRSLYICEDLKEGEALTVQNLRAIRPGMGLSPKHYQDVLGKKVVRSVKRGTPLSWEIIR